MNIYLELTHKFNKGRLRSIISSGQAVVMHRIAIMSKDGDWIIREDTETINHILTVLASYQAHYRFSAPLDIRWLEYGWSAHFEFNHQKLRVRTDFFSRPPRISEEDLKNLWQEQKEKEIPFLDLKRLADIKKTNREKDYVVIGELARLMTDVRYQLLYSRSARDLIVLANSYPELVNQLTKQRPVLKSLDSGRDKIEEALDAERRNLIRQNEERLHKYSQAVQKWKEHWKAVEQEISGLSLLRAHDIIVTRAAQLLPFKPNGALKVM